jgi:hypothetical protein
MPVLEKECEGGLLPRIRWISVSHQIWRLPTRGLRCKSADDVALDIVRLGKGSADNIRAGGRHNPHQQAEDMTAATTIATPKNP